MVTTLTQPHAAPHSTQTATTDAVIQTQNLTKRYGRVVALDRLDLNVPRTAVGLLGANGSGKTTLIRLLLGLAKPTEGDAKVLGFDTKTQGVEIRRQVGYMPESDALPAGATAADFVAHMAEMSGLPARAARQRAADVLYQVGLDEERYRLIKGFSTGMKQRVKLAQAIVHDPQLVFLDEPTNGMDPQGREEMLELVIRIHRMLGISVVVSSHILEDIERICQYVVILDNGLLVGAESIVDLGQGGGDIIVRVDGDTAGFLQRLAGLGIQARPAGAEYARDEYVLPWTDDSIYDVVRDTAADLDVSIRSLRGRARSLEDIYFGNIATNGGRPSAQGDD